MTKKCWKPERQSRQAEMSAKFRALGGEVYVAE
jgi:hypothetical protein